MRRNYAWVVTRDYSPQPDAGPGSPENAAGLSGPEGITLTPEEIERHPDAQRFRLCCEGEVCYEGYFVNGGDPGVTGLEPLNDFGMPNAGCTSIEYFQGGEWRRL